MITVCALGLDDDERNRLFLVAGFHRHFVACAHHLEFLPERFVDFFPRWTLAHSPVASQRAGAAIVSGISCPSQISRRLLFLIFAYGMFC